MKHKIITISKFAGSLQILDGVSEDMQIKVIDRDKNETYYLIPEQTETQTINLTVAETLEMIKTIDKIKSFLK